MKIHKKPGWTKAHTGELFEHPLRLLSGAEVRVFANIRKGQKEPHVVIRPPLSLLSASEQAIVQQAIHAKLAMQSAWDKGRHHRQKATT